MNITVFPKKLSGQVTVPPSKSVAHRMVIAAALSNGVSEITNLYPSVDILATMDCMRALGAKIDFDGDKAVIEGIKDIPESAVLDIDRGVIEWYSNNNGSETALSSISMK